MARAVAANARVMSAPEIRYRALTAPSSPGTKRFCNVALIGSVTI